LVKVSFLWNPKEPKERVKPSLGTRKVIKPFKVSNYGNSEEEQNRYHYLWLILGLTKNPGRLSNQIGTEDNLLKGFILDSEIY